MQLGKAADRVFAEPLVVADVWKSGSIVKYIDVCLLQIIMQVSVIRLIGARL